jgi:hypothetical protein
MPDNIEVIQESLSALTEEAAINAPLWHRPAISRIEVVKTLNGGGDAIDSDDASGPSSCC